SVKPASNPVELECHRSEFLRSVGSVTSSRVFATHAPCQNKDSSCRCSESGSSQPHCHDLPFVWTSRQTVPCVIAFHGESLACETRLCGCLGVPCALPGGEQPFGEFD